MARKENLESRILPEMLKDPFFYGEAAYGGCAVILGLDSLCSLISSFKEPLYFSAAVVFGVGSLLSYKISRSYRESRNRM